MYSKPKGIYIKHRDRSQRRFSPRSDDEEDNAPSSDTERRLSSEVVVENLGQGHISAEAVKTEPQWPKKNFENDDPEDKSDTKSESITEDADNSQTKSTDSGAVFPDRAQQYMVNNNSYKDLTRAKYITVPEAKSAKKENEDSPPRKSTAGSVKSFSRPAESIQKNPIPKAFVKPVARVSGTYRGFPTGTQTKQSHIATIRLRKRSQKSQMATLKAIPKNGTVRTVKGYHLGHNVTVRGHNTGHILKQLKQTGYDLPDGTLAFRRTTALPDRKEYCFSEFAIELDRSERDSFIPGDALSGRIILEASAKVEIRFVELLIIGMSSVHFAKNDPNTAKNSQETLINKRSFVMGSPDGRWNSVITPGKYVSKFKFILPENLPSTIKYENKEHGLSFEVGYLIKARICDEIGSSSTRSTHSTNNYVKVLLSRRHPFYVRRPFDIHSIPNGMQPVNHSEYINLNCLPIFMNSATITLSLDRSVFLAGDEIRVKLITSVKTADKVRSLTCELQQTVLSSLKPRQLFTVIQLHEHQPQGIPFKQNSSTGVMFEFIIPTHSQFIPSFLQGTNLLKASYSVLMTVNFTSCSGRLFLDCPIVIGPCVDPMNLNKINAVPIFNRPKRFPHFTKDSNVAVPKVQNGTAHSAIDGKRVSTTYKSQGTNFLCCCVDENDL